MLITTVVVVVMQRTHIIIWQQRRARVCVCECVGVGWGVGATHMIDTATVKHLRVVVTVVKIRASKFSSVMKMKFWPSALTTVNMAICF